MKFLESVLVVQLALYCLISSACSLNHPDEQKDNVPSKLMRTKRGFGDFISGAREKARENLKIGARASVAAGKKINKAVCKLWDSAEVSLSGDPNYESSLRCADEKNPKNEEILDPNTDSNKEKASVSDFELTPSPRADNDSGSSTYLPPGGDLPGNTSGNSNVPSNSSNQNDNNQKPDKDKKENEDKSNSTFGEFTPPDPGFLLGENKTKSSNSNSTPNYLNDLSTATIRGIRFSTRSPLVRSTVSPNEDEREILDERNGFKPNDAILPIVPPLFSTPDLFGSTPGGESIFGSTTQPSIGKNCRCTCDATNSNKPPNEVIDAERNDKMASDTFNSPGNSPIRIRLIKKESPIVVRRSASSAKVPQEAFSII